MKELQWEIQYKKLTMVLWALFFSGTSFSAISPYYQTVNEIKGILDKNELLVGLDRAPIKAIYKEVDKSMYSVIADNDCSVYAHIDYIKASRNYTGPLEFKVRTSHEVCETVTNLYQNPGSYHFGVDQIKAILDSNEVAAQLGGVLPITSIVRVKEQIDFEFIIPLNDNDSEDRVVEEAEEEIEPPSLEEDLAFNMLYEVTAGQCTITVDANRKIEFVPNTPNNTIIQISPTSEYEIEIKLLRCKS